MMGHEEGITANCGDWRYPWRGDGAKIDAPALMAKHGDLEIARLAGKLRCTTCGPSAGGGPAGLAVAGRDR